ncbi:MAG: LLM class flavin-dependent oxidoreductase [Acidimicrobiia bacterium]|nr:LLM class flavin-dependent oxidoreductase [Acidimicrobiia bacterium]NNL47191.1 LLM class flavin-dependent oxidoreductase [Acidimicrobiia bacterium]
MELGITSFAETIPDPASGITISHGERLRQVLEEIDVAEAVGLDVYGLGEHHRPDFASSAPAVVLAAAAGRTSSIRLFPAVSVLSTDDPVRVFQQYATLDLVSSGRAELLVGRGSFIESFPLFGYDLEDYEELFAEKLDLLLQIRDNERVSWSGRFRSPIDGAGVYPRTERPLPIRVAVGGTPQSIVRAATRGLPVALAIIGGSPGRFKALADLHRRTLVSSGFDPNEVPLSVHGHGYVAESSDQAADEFYDSYATAMTRIGRERGWGPMTREQYEMMRGPDGSLVLGDPETVAAKILRWQEILGIHRFELHVSVGTLPHEQVLRSIELLGTKVAPLLRS